MAKKTGISSFDIVGDIAIFEAQKASKAEMRRMALRIKKAHPRIKTVLARKGERTGEFRLSSLRKVLGKETETVHREHGLRFRLDPSKVYFSSRESTERMHIASMVRPGETVMVLFAGVGPYGIAIASRQPRVGRVYQVEINPQGYEYMKQNIAMNRMSHLVVPILGDARKVCKPFGGKIDRVVMPLPREGHRFLIQVMKCLKKRGFIHFYAVGRHTKGSSGNRAEEEVFGPAVRLVEKAAKKLGRKVRILARRRVLPYSPGAWKICIDAEVRA